MQREGGKRKSGRVNLRVFGDKGGQKKPGRREDLRSTMFPWVHGHDSSKKEELNRQEDV